MAKRYHYRTLTYQGRTRTTTEWGEPLGLSGAAIRKRVDALGWSVARAVTTPRQQRGSAEHRYCRMASAIAAYLNDHPEEARRYA